MGKYERDWSDLAEISLCEEFGGTLVSRDYSTKGDIKIGNIFYELKSTKNKNLSLNTLANLGQNSLTEYGCFNGVCWSDFRKDTGFEDYRWNTFKEYRDFKSKTEFYGFANDLKIHRPDIVFDIEERSKQDREDYINYLLSLRQNPEVNKTFLLNMLCGRTSKNKYKKNLNNFEDDFKVILKNDSETKVFEYQDIVDIEDLDNLTFSKKGRTSICLEGDSREYLRISFHWKNKFQGCQTPCLNIFFVK